jgi:hypothetical protein
MRKAVLMILLAGMSSSAAAQWWNLLEFKHWEFDCKEKRGRILFASFNPSPRESSGYANVDDVDAYVVDVDRYTHSGRWKATSPKWEPIPPNSWTEREWKKACRKL